MRGQGHDPAALYPGKEPEPIVQEAGWTPGSVWTGGENLAPTAIRFQDHQARSQSLYRQSYPAHASFLYIIEKKMTHHILPYKKLRNVEYEMSILNLRRYVKQYWRWNDGVGTDEVHIPTDMTFLIHSICLYVECLKILSLWNWTCLLSQLTGLDRNLPLPDISGR